MRIERLFRFPVKGLPAEELARAAVSAEGGVAGDRAVALGNGSTPVADGQWQSCGSFTALKNDGTYEVVHRCLGHLLAEFVSRAASFSEIAKLPQ